VKIAVLAFENLNDIKLWASIPYYVIKNLKEQAHEVQLVHQIPNDLIPFSVTLKRIWYNKILNKKKGIYRYERLKSILKLKSIIINEKLDEFQPDIVLSFFSYQTAFITSKYPIVLWTDATFKLLNTYYPSYKDFCKESVAQSNQIEKKVFHQASMILTSSSWAKKSMIRDYQISSDKIHVIPFGANIETIESERELYDKSLEKINILFVGFDTERKGLKKVVDILKILNKKYNRFQLTVIGPEIQPEFCKRADVRFFGKLNKDILEQAHLLSKAYQEAHLFMILPDIEAYGIVFCEAASYGIPMISHDVGGISEIIKHGENGYTFHKDQSPEIISQKIKALFEDKDNYLKFRTTTFLDYKNRLNWKVAIGKFENLVSTLNRKHIEG
jgi:glycosyltransferase involved in cell wall biosynthesis